MHLIDPDGRFEKKTLDSILAERHIVDLLLQRHINIDLKDNQGITALMIAARSKGFHKCDKKSFYT